MSSASFKNLLGKKFSRLTVASRAENDADGRAWWNCVCACGSSKKVRGKHLLNGRVRSCGCMRKEQVGLLKLSHGHNRKGGRSRTYGIWANMVQRCENESSTSWSYYGSRGITVCRRWKESFSTFLSDMGECPPGLTIERRDASGNYNPINCEWASRETQANNRRPRRTRCKTS